MGRREKLGGIHIGRSSLKKSENQNDNLYGVWDIDKFADASPRSKSWWYKHIYDFPEIKAFSNWEGKAEFEQWAFDAVKANEWLLRTFVYKN